MTAPITPTGFYTTGDLRERGWTVTLISKLLVKPDAVQDHKRGLYRVVRNLWRIERVDAAMQSPEFADAMAVRAERALIPQRRRAEFDLKYSGWRGALPEACHGLHSLNRLAKHESCSRANRSEIYALKNRFVKLLYKSGYCAACFEHILMLAARICRECRGTSPQYRDPNDYCEHCNNTGIYLTEKRLRFYAFTFSIGSGYTWHQPAESVDYPITTTHPPADWSGVAKENPLLLPRSEFARIKELLRWVLDRADGAGPEAEPEYLPEREAVRVSGEQEGLF